jgi:hypothetical protein
LPTREKFNNSFTASRILAHHAFSSAQNPPDKKREELKSAAR